MEKLTKWDFDEKMKVGQFENQTLYLFRRKPKISTKYLR